MSEVNYKQGATSVWSDGEKVVVSNPTGAQHIKANIEQIFGVGEYDKLYDVKYGYSVVQNRNPHSKTVEFSSGYIPKRVRVDMQIWGTPGTSEEDYSEFFHRNEE